jgi:hypothetical protein
MLSAISPLTCHTSSNVVPHSHTPRDVWYDLFCRREHRPATVTSSSAQKGPLVHQVRNSHISHSQQYTTTDPEITAAFNKQKGSNIFTQGYSTYIEHTQPQNHRHPRYYVKLFRTNYHHLHICNASQPTSQASGSPTLLYHGPLGVDCQPNADHLPRHLFYSSTNM